MANFLSAGCNRVEMMAVVLGLTLFACSSIEEKKPVGTVYRDEVDFRASVRHPFFVKKDTKLSPKVCFDQGHGSLSCLKGRYQPVLSLLESDGLQVEYRDGQFSTASLKSCDLLYLSASTRAFTSDEVDAIHLWVDRGGGLLLATDHSPMADAMESVLESFGVQGSLYSVRSPSTPVPPFKKSGIFEISGKRHLSSHSILRGRDDSERVRKVFFFYGQALRMVKEDTSAQFLLAAEDANIDFEETSPSLLHFPALGVALEVGKGRVVVLGDATIFTSKFDETLGEKTGINRPGSDNVLLAINVFRWLARGLK